MKLLATFAACLLAMCAFAANAAADFGFAKFEAKAVEANGSPSTTAGGHPFALITDIGFNEVSNEEGVFPDGNVRDLEVDLPAGFAGNVGSMPTCPRIKLAETSCPVASQVGVVTVTLNVGSSFQETLPVFNLEHGPGIAADFGFVYIGVPIHIIFSAPNDNDYRLRATIEGISEAYPVLNTKLTVWGVPADPSHDGQRGSNFRCYVDAEDPSCSGPEFGGGISAGVPQIPFLTNPTACGPTGVAQARARSYQDPSVWVSTQMEMAGPISGCDELQFKPTIEVEPATSQAGAPSGLAVDVRVPFNENPNGIAVPSVRRTSVTLPEGVTISPSSADGLVGCTDAQAAVASPDPVTCPPASKIGTVEVDSPLLPEPLTGSVFLGTQLSSDPASGDMFRMFAIATSVQSGVSIRLPARLLVDPRTGQITTVFEGSPQLPFKTYHLEMKSGPRSPLAMPDTCGTYSTQAAITPWADPDAAPVEASATFEIDQGCTPSPFAPDLEAGSADPVAGKSSAFTLRITRADGQPDLSAIETKLPPGLLAKLKGVPLCDETGAASGNCSAASQVGRAVVGSGPGSNPIYVPQPGRTPTAVYLAGPYKGAPYSLVVKVPAQAGPFDLGTSVVRNALLIDPKTTQVTVKSDPLPQILGGVPITYRDVRIETDRADFTVNPTSCEEMSVTSTLASVTGATATPSSRFQVAECERLAFKPTLGITLSGQVKRGGNPALKAVLTQPKGEANIGKVSVLLPQGQMIDNAHINNPCTRAQYAEAACPKSSILGKARAFSPLLDKALEGPVYFRSNGGARELPDLVADLHGQIHVELVGFIDSVKTGKETARVRTRFLGVPDAPVSKFVLEMKGGKKGLLENGYNLCRAQPKADVKMDGQNGKVYDFTLKVRRSCGKGK